MTGAALFYKDLKEEWRRCKKHPGSTILLRAWADVSDLLITSRLNDAHIRLVGGEMYLSC